MNMVLISLHRQGVFRQQWFAFTFFMSDFGNSPFPFISVLSLMITSLCFRKFTKWLLLLWQSTFLEKIIHLLFYFTHYWIRTFALIKKTFKPNMNFLICVPNIEYTRYPLTKHVPFTDLWTNKNSVSMVSE